MTDDSYSSHGWSLLRAAIRDERLTDDDLRALIGLCLRVYGPPVDERLDAARQHANEVFIDSMVKSRGTRSGRAAPDDVFQPLENAYVAPVVKASATEIIRADMLRRGEISELPSDPLARAIVIADMRRRNETPPGGKL